MDEARFAEARALYDAGDYRAAAKSFIAAADDVTEGNGVAFHMAGNSLMRVRRYADAAAAYERALDDDVYDRRAAVFVNLAQARSSLGEYADSIRAYEAALSEPGYASPYKALQGMAGALLEMGHVEDAASAYRRAALDERNPDPGRALVNLGLCFMALGRPADAAEAYKAALGFEDYEGRGKALANLGQAQHAMGRSTDAIRSFEKAMNLHGYVLSSAAFADYEASLEAITPPEQSTVEGWSTGEIETVEAKSVDSTGWDTEDLAALADQEAAADAISGPMTPLDIDRLGPGAGVVDDDAEVSAFLERTDDEMKARDRERRRSERASRRAERNPWVFLAAAAALLLVIAIPLGLLYSAGFGWPSQAGTVDELLEAHSSGKAVDAYWVAVPDRDVAKEMAKIPPIKSFKLDSVQRSSTVSTVSVTVTPQKGAALHYGITLHREGVGWKVSGVENDWQASGGS